MTVAGHKRLTIALAVMVVLLATLCGKLLWDYSLLGLRIELARDQIEVFDEDRARALASNVAEAAEYLRGVVNYYPSGTKQAQGSRLDRIVEHQRTETVRSIIAYLRTKSGEDLGDSPERWLEKYGKK